MASPAVVLPGDIVSAASLTAAGASTSKTLHLGPGLRHVPPSQVVPTVAGQLVVNPRKNLVSVERTTGRYLPSPNDRVIGTVLRSSADAYLVQLAPYATPAVLPHLSFESASRKTRPILPAGSLVYARVAAGRGASISRFLDVELECVAAETGKADGLGPLGLLGPGAQGAGVGAAAAAGAASTTSPGAAGTSGMVFGVSLGMARRLLLPRSAEDGALVVLDELEAAGLAFETVVGRNGRVWVDAAVAPAQSDARAKSRPKADQGSAARLAATVIVVGRAIVETDEAGLGVDEQRKLVRRLVAAMP